MEKEEFQKIVDRYLKGESSAAEEEFLFRILDSFQREGLEWDQKLMGERKQLGRKLFERTSGEISIREKRGRLIKIRWMSAAAIFIIFISGIYYGLYNISKPLSDTIAERYKNDIAPGDTVATLILADGSRLHLDDRQAGALTNQGSVIIRKTREGQLVYDMSKMKAGADQDEVYNTISTPKGGKYMLILADGSKVWLNSATSLRFPVAFSGKERRVELSGEAYFEVAKNKEKPFHVSFAGTDVAVLGTHFNINSYKDEPFMKTTLLEGAVEVSRNGLKERLNPSDQAVVSSSSPVIKVTQGADTEEVIGWKNGVFQFKDTHLKDIMRRLSRWYDIEVEYEKGVPDEEFTGIISEKVHITSVLEMLEQGGGIAFRIEGRKVIVMESGK